MTSILQASLTGGELSPSLSGRVDLARYSISLELCRNAIVQPYGGIVNRPGMRYVATTKNESDRVRLIPFQFSTEQAYALEFGDRYMRVYKDGSRINTEITTPYAVEDLPLLSYTQSADVMTFAHPDYAPRTLSRLAHDSWVMDTFDFKGGPFSDINTDTGVSVYSSAETGTVTITATSAIFSASNVGQLFYLQQRDFGLPWEPGKYVLANDIRRSDGKYYQARAAGTTGTLRPLQTNADIWCDGGVDWFYIHQGYGTALITAVASNGLSCTATVITRLPGGGTQAGFGTPKTFSSVTIGTGSCARLVSTSHGITTNGMAFVVFTLPGGGAWRFTAYAVVVDANNIDLPSIAEDWTFGLPGSGTIAFETAGNTSYGSTYKWAFCDWGGDQGYPGTVCYYQQRLVFGGCTARPDTIWMSRVNSFTDFGVSSPVVDDDPVTVTFNSTSVNAIRGLIPLDKLIVGTSGGVFAMFSGNADAVTPTNIGARLQSFRGASTIPPIGVGESVLYVQNKGQVVRDLGYDFSQDKYLGNDLTAMASHLVLGKSIEEWAWQGHPFQCVWLVRNDGTFLSMTYLREQQVVGWARHDTAGLVESVCVVPEGSEDALYLSVNRDGTRYIERMESREVLDIRDAFFVDSGLSYDGRNTGSTLMTLTGGTNWDTDETLTLTASSATFAYSAGTDIGDQVWFTDSDGIIYRLTITGVSSTTVASVIPSRTIPATMRGVPRSEWAWARNTFTGLDHLEGKTVSILADGYVQEQQTVVGGSIALTPPASVVHVGLPYDSDLKTLDPSFQAPNTTMDKMKQITRVRALLQESRGVKAGRDFDHLYETKSRGVENYDVVPSLQTGVVTVDIACNWDRSGAVCFRQSYPLPITWLALIPDTTFGGAK